MIKKINAKLLFKLASPLLIISSTATVVSCGHKTSAPVKYTFDDFVLDAENASKIDIVTNSKLKEWVKTTDQELSMGEFSQNDELGSVSVNITRTPTNDKDNPYVATFTIQYQNNVKYDVTKWKCSSGPKPTNAFSWDKFKGLALNVTPQQLLNTIKPASNTAKYQWNFYGTDQQKIWSDKDLAVFDTFGALTSKDSYQGMKGKPVVDDTAKTITAIICKKFFNPDGSIDQNVEGLYFSDPIKVVATYTEGQEYKLSVWNSDKTMPTKQIESVERTASLITAITPSNGENIKDNFNDTNWMIYQENITYKIIDDSGINHSAKNNIFDVLINRYPNEFNGAFTGNVTLTSASSAPANSTEKQFKLVFSFLTYTGIDNAKNSHPYANFSHHISLYWNALFVDGKSPNHGVWPFNYTWTGILTNTK